MSQNIPTVEILNIIQIIVALSCFCVFANNNEPINDYTQFIPTNQKKEFISQHPCLRKCNNFTMTCEYNFILENYNTMSRACLKCPFVQNDCTAKYCIPTNGIYRGIFSINRQLPGTPIEVCEGDEIIVNVHNNYVTDATTLHWHGQHQRFSPYMDGVPYLTQCPIQAGSSFQYRWSANNPGTHFYHSHSGMHRAEGSFGPLIVRTAYDSLLNLYDYDLPLHTICVFDWTRKSSLDILVERLHSNGSNNVDTIIVNGYGRYKEFFFQNKSFHTPIAEFIVEKGKRFRFRLINAGSLNCPVRLSIDKHTMTVISTDGNPIEPVEVDILTSYSGERFDFVLNANQKSDLYWIRFVGLLDCIKGNDTKAFQVAVLRYKGENEKYPKGDEPTHDNSLREGIDLNPFNVGTTNERLLVLSDLKSQTDLDSVLAGKPYIQYYASFDFYSIQNSKSSKMTENSRLQDILEFVKIPQINHITMVFPPFPLSFEKIIYNAIQLCNESSVENCTKKFCECIHVVSVPLNVNVEVILIDEGVAYDANHPFHLHGYSFAVVAMGKIGNFTNAENVRKLDKSGGIKRNLKNPPIKDTVTVPDGGYTIIRFYTNNPGFWLLHCHLDHHTFQGMAVVFKVGSREDITDVPDNFPTCGNYPPHEKYSSGSCSYSILYYYIFVLSLLVSNLVNYFN